MNQTKSLTLAALCVTVMTSASTAQQFVPVEPLPGDDWVRIRGVSADGSVAAGSSYAGSWTNGRAFIWTADEGTVALPSLGHNSWALDISADGTTIVGGLSDGDNTGVRWVNGELDVLTVTPEIPWIGVLATSGDGNVIVGEAVVDGEFMAVRWTPDGITPLEGPLPGAYTFATAVSEDGNVITGLSEYDAAEAFRWTESTGLEWLGFLPGGSWHSTVVTMSSDGSVMGGQSHVPGGNYAAAIWTEEAGWVEIPSIIASASFANAIQSISGDGSIKVGYNSGSSPSGWQTIMYDKVNGVRVLQEALEADYGIDFGDWNISGNNPGGTNVANVGVSSDGTAFYGSTYHPITFEEASWIAYTEPKGNPADLNGDGVVDVFDLLILLAEWGECDDCPNASCAADLNGDCTVDVFDLLALLANWG